MTIEADPKPQSAPKPQSTSINVGTTSFKPLAGNPQVKGQQVIFQGPPPHVHKFMKRKMKRGCCCLTFLLLINLMLVAYIARKVTIMSMVFSPDSELSYMPGGTHPFCSDLCVDLCVSNDDQDTSITCDVTDCMDSCTQHFTSQNDNDNDDDEEQDIDNQNRMTPSQPEGDDDEDDEDDTVQIDIGMMDDEDDKDDNAGDVDDVDVDMSVEQENEDDKDHNAGDVDDVDVVDMSVEQENEDDEDSQVLDNGRDIPSIMDRRTALRSKLFNKGGMLKRGLKF